MMRNENMIKPQNPQCVQTSVTGSSGLFISNEDNMLLMARYPDNYFDLAIVDPPYGILNNSHGGGKKEWGNYKELKKAKNWDNDIPNKEYFDELMRVSKNQIIWGGNYFLDYLGNTRCFLSWNKMNGTNNMADFELAWTNLDSSCRMFSMHHFSSGYGKKIHHTQKPVKLYEWIIKKYCKENYKILDTHLGSGSIAIAVDNMNKIEKMNLTLTACEIDIEYYIKAMLRIKESTNWQSLF